MDHETNDGRAGGRRPTTRRWLAAWLAPATLLLLMVAVALTRSSTGAALIPLPTTTTTAPTRPTIPVPRETTTTATTTTTPSSPPTTAPPTETPTTTIAAPIPEPPTNPPSSTTEPVPESASPASSEPPVAEQFWVFPPVVVDPGDPAIQPPVIVGVSPYCLNGFGSADVMVQNVDLFHYPIPFTAAYEWSMSSGPTVVAEGTFTIGGWSTHHVNLPAGFDPGTYTFAVTDVDLGSAASADVMIPDCANQQPPQPATYLPHVVIPAVTCSDDVHVENEHLGTGSFLFWIHNQPGDDGTARLYNYDVWYTNDASNQVSVAVGSLGASLPDNTWSFQLIGSASPDVLTAVHADTYNVTVTDDADPALEVVVPVEIPPCVANPPAGDPVAPIYPVTFIDVATQCADPVLLDGRIDYLLLNPNYPMLVGEGIFIYQIDWFLDSTLLGTQHHESPAGISGDYLDDLAPGTYTAELSLSDFPSMTDSVTFTIDDCTAVPQPDPPPLALYGITTVCVPGDATETVLFVVEHHVATTEPFSWRMTGDNGAVGNQAVYLATGEPTMLSADHVPAGTYVLKIGYEADLTIAATASVEVGSCLDPPVEPVDTIDPADPADPADPVQPTTTSPQNSVPTSESGTLPATALSGSLPATR